MAERFEGEKVYEMRREARDRVIAELKRHREELGFIVSIEEETPDTITLKLEVNNSGGGNIKTYRRGFMKMPQFPDGLTIEEEIDNWINHPEEDLHQREDN